MDSKSLLRRRERSLGAGAELFYRHPIQLVRGQGAYVFDVRLQGENETVFFEA